MIQKTSSRTSSKTKQHELEQQINMNAANGPLSGMINFDKMRKTLATSNQMQVKMEKNGSNTQRMPSHNDMYVNQMTSIMPKNNQFKQNGLSQRSNSNKDNSKGQSTLQTIQSTAFNQTQKINKDIIRGANLNLRNTP